MKKIVFLGLLLLLFVSCDKNIKLENMEKKEFVLVNIHKEFGITLSFEGDKVYGFSGVNRYFGNFKLSGTKLVINPLASTKMAGDSKAMKAEDEYLKLLNNADKVVATKEGFKIYTKNDKVLQFVPKEADNK